MVNYKTFVLGILVGVSMAALAFCAAYVARELHLARQAQFDHNELIGLRAQWNDLLPKAINAGIVPGGMRKPNGEVIARAPGFLFEDEELYTSGTQQLIRKKR